MSDHSSTAGEIVQALREAAPQAGVEAGASNDMPTVYVRRDDIIAVLTALRDTPSLQFALMVELTAIDQFPVEPRFEIVYHLACVGPAYAQTGGAAPARRLRVKVRVPGDRALMPTATGVFPCANWPEREVYDLFGIGFEGHPDLRRILTPDEWEGHPLRKDYPVQIRKETSGWSAMQMTADEFAANIQAARDRARREIEKA